MCGIAGVVSSRGAVDRQVLQTMADRLSHRGPDGAGFVLATGEWTRLRHVFGRHVDACDTGLPARVGLGHRRLAILDLSDRGLQPMGTADGRAWVVFNGEIYNYQALRAELTALGHRFRTHTDTEVLLQAYAAWGERAVDRLDGMFAFAIWDDARARLFCARDRLGIKPFYFATPDDQLVFASEIKSVVAHPACRPAADDRAAIGFLAHGNADYGERTLFKGVRALEAAHTLTWDAARGRITIARYWSLAPSSRPDSDEGHVRTLRVALEQAVRSHLVSDVRVGSCLSGGLDSSTLVGLIGHIRRQEPDAAAAIGDALYTFTSCYETQTAFDERQYALAIARDCGARSHLVFPSADDFWSDFARMAWHQDMPFGALSFYAQWRVMRASREAGVKVLIDGQGGDEVFGGYAKFRYAYLASLARGGHLSALAREIAAMVRHRDPYVLDIRNGARYLPPAVRRALRVDTLLESALLAGWSEAVADESTPATRWWRHTRTNGSRGTTLVQRIQADDLTTDTLPQLLRMEDRSSMAFSLEARVPLLDHRIVELGLSLPDHLKVHGGWSKFAVRAAMKGVLPEAVRLRRSKLGFAAPDRAWLKDDLRPRIGELLAGHLRCERYVNLPVLRQWYDATATARENAVSFGGLFRVLSLEMWLRAFSL